MRTDRSYRKALSHEVARAELIANAGHQFDPAIVTACLAVVDGAPSEADRRNAAAAEQASEGSAARSDV